MMNRHALLTILAGLVALGMWTLSQNRGGSGTLTPHAMWTVFLILIPVGLTAIVWQQVRWAAMGCVIYGTVGFALDVATVVQVITKDTDMFPALASSGISGILNFLLIVFGGRAFLDVSGVPPPPGSRPPNPPSPSSSSAA
jgi:hypothetical protein